MTIGIPIDIPTYVTIPFRGHVDETESLIRQLAGDEPERIIVTDNTPYELSGDEHTVHKRLWAAYPGKVDIYSCEHMSLTQMWNIAWRRWHHFHPRRPKANLAILNNDIAVEPGFLHALAKALRSHWRWWAVCPDYSREHRLEDGPAPGIRELHHLGIPRQDALTGGMTGWAFMVRMETPAPMPIDEQFQWWCGDSEVMASIKASGRKIGQVVGLACEHATSTTLNERWKELQPIAHADLDRFMRKRGKRP